MSVPAPRHAAAVPARRRLADRHAPFIVGEAAVFVCLAVLAVIVHSHPGPLPGDAEIERGLQSLLVPHHAVTAVLESISTLNWPIPTAITLALIVAAFLLLRRWLDAAVVPVAAGASSLATLVLSRWVHRPRPSGHGIHPLQVITGTFSFPSGHVTYAVSIFGLFLFLTYQVRRPLHPALIWSIRVLMAALIVLMPVSRMLEGEHWPSDVLGGVLDGAFWLVIFAHIYLWARARWPRLLAHDER